MNNNWGIDVGNINKEWIRKYVPVVKAVKKPKPPKKKKEKKEKKERPTIRKSVLVKKEKIIQPPLTNEPVEESKKLVKIYIQELSPPSPLYNLQYPIEMLIKK